MFVIRKAKESDFPQIMEIYSIAREFMKNNGNPTQWANKYPTDEEIHNSIKNGTHFICFFTDESSSENLIPAGTFLFKDGPDSSYSEITEGCWPNDEPYSVIHSFASTGKYKGTGSFMFEWAFQHCKVLRIDTHKNNRPMQNLLKKFGFNYCGIIYCFPDDYSENSQRIAFLRKN